MTQRDRKPRPGADEGAAYTAAVMGEVKRRRQALAWSAERLAQEMAAAGVPWTRDTVVNLENARRKRLAVHELTCLAYVLDVESPVDLLAPLLPDVPRIPATPMLTVPAAILRDWCERRTGPLRSRVEALDPAEGEHLMREHVERVIRSGDKAAMAGLLEQFSYAFSSGLTLAPEFGVSTIPTGEDVPDGR